MTKNLHETWGVVSFSCPSNSNKRLVYISYTQPGNLRNKLSKERPYTFVPCMFDNQKIVVLNESRLVYDI